MLELTQTYESGKISSTDLEDALSFNMQALERIRSRDIDAFRSLTYRLVYAHFWDGGEEFKDQERVSKVLLELRNFLRSLPDGPDA
jgi:hypothetical protein